MKKPALLLIRGLPGSGKSYLAEKLVERLGVDSTVLLDPDAIDYAGDEYQKLSDELTAEGVDEKFHPYRFSRGRAHAGIREGKVVIWNQAFTNLDGFQKTVVNLTNYAQEQGTELPVLVVEVFIDPEAAKQRIAERVGRGGHEVPAENFERFVNEYRSFASEGFQTIAVDGSAEVDTSAEAVLVALENIS